VAARAIVHDVARRVEANVEVRRAMAARVGVDRLLACGQLRPVEKADGRSRYEIHPDLGLPYRLLEVHCPTTGHRYQLRELDAQGQPQALRTLTPVAFGELAFDLGGLS
jgi:hypothetical protein